MFLRKINKWTNETFYKRNNYLIKFISMNCKHLYDENTYVFVCDEEFIKNVLQKFIHININESRRIKSIVIESFSDELYNLIQLSNDIVYAFKVYLNDDKLDKLVKD